MYKKGGCSSGQWYIEKSSEAQEKRRAQQAPLLGGNLRTPWETRGTWHVRSYDETWFIAISTS